MKKLKILTAIFVLLTIFFSQAQAANKPLRIARLPMICQRIQPDIETCAFLETKISRAVMIPLNGTLKLADYLNPKSSATELNNIYQNMRAENKKTKLVETIKPLAKNLNADIIVLPILLHYAQYQIHVGYNFESRLVSNVSAELIVYDRRTDELIDKKISRSFNDSASKFGTASYLAGECFDKLIDETNLKRKFMAIK